MKTIESLLSSDIIQALGWAVLHSIWQGMTIALMILLLLFVFKRSSSHFRYVLYATGLFAMLACLGFTFAHTYGELSAATGQAAAGSHVLSGFFTPPSAVRSPEAALPLTTRAGMLLKENIGLVTVCWLLGAALFSLRLFGGLLYVQKMLKNGTRETSAEWTERLQSMAQRLGIDKSIQLLASAVAQTPMIIGHFKPVILVPAGLLTGLSIEQVEAVLAHELAHIKRDDWLVNLLGSIVETLFFFHPVAWWLSERIREEREKCCDDMAVLATGDALTYVRTLSVMQQVGESPTMAMAFGKKKYLLERIKRLVSPGHREKSFSARLTLLFVTLICIIAFAFVIKPDKQEGDFLQVLQGEISSTQTGKRDNSRIDQDTLPGNEQRKGKQEKRNAEKTDKEKAGKKKINKSRREEASGWEDSTWEEESARQDFPPFHLPVPPVMPEELDSLIGSHLSGIDNFSADLFGFDNFQVFPFEPFPFGLFFDGTLPPDFDFQFQDTLELDGFSSDSSFSAIKEELLEARRRSRQAREEYMEKMEAYREKVREHQHTLRDLQHSYQEQLRGYQEQVREEQSKQRARQLELREKQSEAIKEAQNRRMEALREKHEALELKNEKFSEELREKLQKDGLISEGDPVDLYYNADKDEIKVNGRELNEKEKNKYKEFLRQRDHLPSSGKFHYKNN